MVEDIIFRSLCQSCESAWATRFERDWLCAPCFHAARRDEAIAFRGHRARFRRAAICSFAADMRRFHPHNHRLRRVVRRTVTRAERRLNKALLQEAVQMV